MMAYSETPPNFYGNISAENATYDLPFDVSQLESANSFFEGSRPYCRALYDFSSSYPEELNFFAGDLLYLTRCVNDEWMDGECQRTGQRGIFPTGFVEVVVPLPEDELTQQSEPSLSTNSSFSALYAAPPVEDTVDIATQIGVASVLYAFEPRYGDELAVRVGDSVQMLALPNAEWAKCRDPTSGQVGIVPQTFLHIFLDPASQSAMLVALEEKSCLDSTQNSGIEPSESSAISFSTPASFPPSTFSFDPSSQQTTALYPSILENNSSNDWTNPWNTSTASFQLKEVAVPPPPPPRPPPPKLPSIDPNSATKRTLLPPPLRSVSSSNVIGGSIKTTSKKWHGNKRRPELLQANPKANTRSEAVSEGEEADESLIVHVAEAHNAPHLQLNTAPAHQSDTKQKVVLDFLNTERAYLFDLDTWEACIQESAELSAEDKQALTGGYAPLKQLSRALISALEAQKDLAAGDQKFGQTIMELREQFFSAFANHFRCVEQISAAVESDDGADPALQQTLQKCVGAMRQRGSNVFDVPSAVARPIQRCLKYPLYVGELLKLTPIHHPDHPKLMEAMRQLGTLATRMNECKRRKELIRKYRAQEQLSLTDRLSRINMHSLAKKTNRLKYRINRTIGLGTVVKDSEFDYLVGLLEEAERRLCKFLYCAQLYKKHVELAAKRHEESYKSVSQAPSGERVVKAFANMFRRVDEICRQHLQQFDQEVITEGKKLVRSELTKLVHKRCDKLADYESAKATTGKNAQEVEMRHNEFEALNNQIKLQLPRVISTINKRVLRLIQRVNELHLEFLRRMDEWFDNERPDKVRKCAASAPPFRAHLSASLKHTLVELDKIAAHLYQRPAEGEQGTTALDLQRKKSSFRISFRAPKQPANKKVSSASLSLQRRPQTARERDALVKICQTQCQAATLRRCARAWENGQLVLREGDVLMVKEHRQDGFSVCDNAVCTGLVPLELLRPFENFAAAVAGTPPASQLGSSAKQSRHQQHSAPTTPQHQTQFPLDDFLAAMSPNPNGGTALATTAAIQTHTRPNQLSKNAADQDLIDLDADLIQLDSPPRLEDQSRDLAPIVALPPATKHSQFVLPQPMINYEREPGTKRLSEPNLQQPSWAGGTATMFPPQPKGEYTPASDDPFDELFQTALQLSRSSTASPSSTKRVESPPVPAIPLRPQQGASGGIQPVRIAPPPPSQKRARPPLQQQHHFQSFAVCAFDFTPIPLGQTTSSQLAIREGETLEVLRRQDDAGNVEWWLVRRTDGQQQQGYVPANFLNANNTRI